MVGPSMILENLKRSNEKIIPNSSIRRKKTIKRKLKSICYTHKCYATKIIGYSELEKRG